MASPATNSPTATATTTTTRSAPSARPPVRSPIARSASSSPRWRQWDSPPSPIDWSSSGSAGSAAPKSHDPEAGGILSCPFRSVRSGIRENRRQYRMMRKSPGIGFYWVFLILGAGYAPFCYAIEPRTLYVSEKGGNAIDPKTQAPLERLPPSYKLSEPFLLNSQGDRYERGKGQSPYLGPDGKIYVGFYLPTNPQRLAAVEVGQLATLAPPALAIRTPEASLAGISNHELMALSCQYVQAVPPELTQLLSIWPALKEKLNPDMSQAMKFVRQFHNTL